LGKFVVNTIFRTDIHLAGKLASHLLASEIEHLSFKNLEFRLRHPNSLNHDILRLSKTALSLSITKGIGILYKGEVEKKRL